MTEGDAGSEASAAVYEEALSCLSSLITRRTRADGTNRGDQFDLLFDYLKILELDEAISQLKVVHVAGTKGKGSTCTFTESILRSCGLHTGLFTSPHLIDVRERFRLDGMEISKEKFLAYFWWCWHRLREKTDDDVPMPTYFRFLTLLAFKIFIAEQVDVAILEVGLGGKFDATNVVRTPVVCGISSLGYDHMEILGNTLGEIAGEKAGIFKQGVPAYTVPQPEEAMSVLEAKATDLGISLQVALPLDKETLGGLQLGLHGEHQYINAGLAVAISRAWLLNTRYAEEIFSNLTTNNLPEQFIRGLTLATIQGRAQIVHDSYSVKQTSNFGLAGLVFYLDGAHSPESMAICARWFSHAIKENAHTVDHSTKPVHILLFNCMTVRDPHLLLPPLINTCSEHGVQFDKALFVPNLSMLNKVASQSIPEPNPQQIDLSWQLSIKKVWENTIHRNKELTSDKIMDVNEAFKQGEKLNTGSIENSAVFHSLPSAIRWLREHAQQNNSRCIQVLVTGSLVLVGDVLRLIKK
ncbi:Folylpolyglutamate synthase [Apostasia shenzhenica]|uniref:Folylpolyglutamate synthase n=1 Tax=Apostasia shenzhenica TaxID=1088818 RepID=A0A2I0A8V8_9ASPA|nr:Folylpolyglutamate synthase [Apostasia shenzhenica]